MTKGCVLVRKDEPISETGEKPNAFRKWDLSAMLLILEKNVD